MAGQQIHTRFIIAILTGFQYVPTGPKVPSGPTPLYHSQRESGQEFAIYPAEAENDSTVEQALEIHASWLQRALAVLDRIASRHRRSTIAAHLVTGIAGEDAAFHFLRGRGYVIVARRWSSGGRPGDIDLVAWHGPVLCFIEVKSRTARDMTPAEAAVDRHKMYTLRALAKRYIRQLPQAEQPQVRFDVISVYLVPGEERAFVHFENAFGWDG